MVILKSTFRSKSINSETDSAKALNGNVAVAVGSHNEYKKILAYVVVTLIIALIVIFVFVPLSSMSSPTTEDPYGDDCRISIVESIPDNLTFEAGSVSFPSTFSAWGDLVDNASRSIDIASFYWTMLGSDVIKDPSNWQGEETFKKLKSAVKDRNIQLRIVMNLPSEHYPDNDTRELEEAGAQVRSIDFKKLFNAGILHTKLWIVDGKHVYVGSANMDWRSLTQVKELGIVLNSCQCLAADVSKIFDVYWYLGKPGTPIPPKWPNDLKTEFNKDSPMKIKLNGTDSLVYLSSSPKEFDPVGRTNDIDAILNIIETAEEFIYIAVMDYSPMILFSRNRTFWPVIDNALRKVSLEKGIKVRLLASKWNSTRPDMIKYLRSLQDLNGIQAGFKVNASIETKLFIVPAFTEAQAKIPYARVNHNKYMVTDKVAYIGTSNWSGDYFTTTAGVGLVVQQKSTPDVSASPTVQQQLLAIFERDWNSKYTHPIVPETESELWRDKPF